jgi:hypothetical protein
MSSNEYDFVCGSGGLKAMYLSTLPSFMYLQTPSRIRIVRASGASSGSFCATCALARLDVSKTLDIYKREYQRFQSSKDRIYPGELVRLFCQELFPDDIHIRCNHRLFISIHLLTPLGIRHDVISSWSSRQDLIDCILASCTIPFITFPKPYYTFRDSICMDGICPHLFEDGQREVLCIDLWKVDYSLDSLHIDDPKIEDFAHSGLQEFKRWWSRPHDHPVFTRYRYPDTHLLSQQVLSWTLQITPWLILLYVVRKRWLPLFQRLH